MSWPIILVYALAVARVTRLIVEDKLTEPWRVKLVDWAVARAAARQYGADWTKVADQPAERKSMARMYEQFHGLPKLGYLVTCPWCSSIYVAAVAAPLAYLWGTSPWLLIPALALAFSHVTGFLASKES